MNHAPETASADDRPAVAGEDGPTAVPILDYRREAPPSKLTRPLGPGAVGVALGVIVALLCIVFSGGNVPAIFIAAFAGAFAFMVFVTARVKAEWAVSDPVHFQLVTAAALFVVAGVVICARAGDGASLSWSGSQFWWVDNPGYRYGRDFALRPWPAVAIGALWFATVVAVDRLRRK